MKSLQVKLSVAAFAVLLFAFGGATRISAQNGGKAEPNRISFKKGANRAIVTKTLKMDEEMEYIFGAKSGQKISLKIVSTPRGKFSAFKVLGDGFDFASEYDNNYDLTFTAPETGNYLVFVKLRPTDKIKSARFALTLSIK
jgi:hypothetical protein